MSVPHLFYEIDGTPIPPGEYILQYTDYQKLVVVPTNNQ